MGDPARGWYTHIVVGRPCTWVVYLPPDSQPPGRQVEALGRAGVLASLDPAGICIEIEIVGTYTMRRAQDHIYTLHAEFLSPYLQS